MKKSVFLAIAGIIRKSQKTPFCQELQTNS